MWPSRAWSKMGDADKMADVRRGVCESAGHTTEEPGSSVRGLKEGYQWREQSIRWREAVLF